MLSWIVPEEMVKTAMESQRKIDIESIRTVDLSYKLLDENVNIQRIRKYFEKDSWDFLKNQLASLKDNVEYLCYSCKKNLHAEDSLACDGCLEWQHMKCAGLKNFPKKSYWLCKCCL